MTTATLTDRRLNPDRPMHRWPAHVVRGSELATMLDQLASGPPGGDGRREAVIAHPEAQAPGLGLAPGIGVTVGVLLAGETTVLRRQNASIYTLCLEGAADTRIGETDFAIGKYDCWVSPSMQRTTLSNVGPERFVYLEYSNAPALQKLEAFYSELDPPARADEAQGLAAAANFSVQLGRVKEMVPAFAIGDAGAWLMPYEHLIDPEYVDARPLQWCWSDVEPFLGRVRSLGQGYNGRPLFCYYNPATGTRNGTTPSFFATIASIGPNLVGPAHRHGSAAINLILEGSGYSIVDGVRLDWAAGDIMLSAPSWTPHGHATGPDGALVVTVQDHPLHIATESLIWQENLKDGPILSLGAQAGFQTNLASVSDGPGQ